MHGSLLDTHFFQQVLLRSAPAAFPCRGKVLPHLVFFNIYLFTSEELPDFVQNTAPQRLTLTQPRP